MMPVTRPRTSGVRATNAAPSRISAKTPGAALWRAPDAVRHLLAVRPDRVMYGTDFPIIPYAWDRELRRLVSAGLPPDALARLLTGNAERFYG